MKLIFQADFHLRSGAPVNRIDHYYMAQVGKFKQLIRFAKQHNAVILGGGDLWDKPSVSFKIFNPIHEMILDFPGKFYVVTGNHDVYYHNLETLQDTALYALSETKDGIEIVQGALEIKKGIVLHGVGWETTPSDPIPGKYNIFLGHVSVFKDRIPFYWKGEGYTQKTLKEKYPGFDLYLCGDIHHPFVDGNVVVSGSMMREGIDQKDQRPRCYLIDTDTGDIKPLYYEISQDVFCDVEQAVTQEMDLSHLLDAMKKSAGVRASFKRDCLTLSAEDQQAKAMLQEIFDEFN